MTPDRETLIKLRFEDGMTREDIADHHAVSVATVRRWIKVLNVPRLTRSKPPRRNENFSPSGEIIARLTFDDRYTSIEVAGMRLGGRLVERMGVGYYLDGHPAGIDTILAASQESVSRSSGELDSQSV